MCTTISPCCTSTLEVNIVSLIHSIKITLHVWCDLSLSPKVLLRKRDMGYEKKRKKTPCSKHEWKKCLRHEKREMDSPCPKYRRKRREM
jgi:hypothetical protein